MEIERYNAAITHPYTSIITTHLLRRGFRLSTEDLASEMVSVIRFPFISIKEIAEVLTRLELGVAFYKPTIDQIYPNNSSTISWLRAVSSSALIPIEILAVGSKRVRISSSKLGEYFMPRKEFDDRWAGIVLEVDDPGSSLNKASDRELNIYQSKIEVASGVLSKEQCERLLEYCTNTGYKSSLIGKSDGTEGVDRKVRSSTSTLFTDRKHPDLAYIYNWCAAREAISTDDIEDIQCVRYKGAQRFLPHYDSSTQLQRRATYLFYINDSFEGGQTYFPKLPLYVKPVAGDCLIFENCTPDGRILALSQHGGLPISNGVKYALNVWIRNTKTRPTMK